MSELKSGMGELKRVKELDVQVGDVVGEYGQPLVVKVFIRGEWYTYIWVREAPPYMKLGVVTNPNIRQFYRRLAEYKELNGGATPSRRELTKIANASLGSVQAWVRALQNYGFIVENPSRKHNRLILTGEKYIPPLAVRGKKKVR